MQLIWALIIIVWGWTAGSPSGFNADVCQVTFGPHSNCVSQQFETEISRSNPVGHEAVFSPWCHLVSWQYTRPPWLGTCSKSPINFNSLHGNVVKYFSFLHSIYLKSVSTYMYSWTIHTFATWIDTTCIFLTHFINSLAHFMEKTRLHIHNVPSHFSFRLLLCPSIAQSFISHISYMWYNEAYCNEYNDILKCGPCNIKFLWKI